MSLWLTVLVMAMVAVLRVMLATPETAMMMIIIMMMISVRAEDKYSQ